MVDEVHEYLGLQRLTQADLVEEMGAFAAMRKEDGEPTESAWKKSKYNNAGGFSTVLESMEAFEEFICALRKMQSCYSEEEWFNLESKPAVSARRPRIFVFLARLSPKDVEEVGFLWQDLEYKCEVWTWFEFKLMHVVVDELFEYHPPEWSSGVLIDAEGMRCRILYPGRLFTINLVEGEDEDEDLRYIRAGDWGVEHIHMCNVSNPIPVSEIAKGAKTIHLHNCILKTDDCDVDGLTQLEMRGCRQDEIKRRRVNY